MDAPRIDVARSATIGSSVTGPLALNFPAPGRFTARTTSKGFGPGQTRPVTVAERSDSVSVVVGETASSLNVARALARATRSTATRMTMAAACSTATWAGRLCSDVAGSAGGAAGGGALGADVLAVGADALAGGVALGGDPLDGGALPPPPASASRSIRPCLSRMIVRSSPSSSTEARLIAPSSGEVSLSVTASRGSRRKSAGASRCRTMRSASRTSPFSTTFGLPSGVREVTTPRSIVTRPAVGLAGAVAGAYGTSGRRRRHRASGAR